MSPPSEVVAAGAALTTTTDRAALSVVPGSSAAPEDAARETRRDAQRFRTKTQPLFPGYLFIGLSDAASSWRSINATQGVSRVVSLYGQYRPVPEALIAGIKARCNSDGVFQATEPLSEGDQVQIQRGPFASFIAEVDSLAPDQRVWVLIDLLGQKSRISQHQHDLTHAL